ncbi:hypothetical protein KAR91_15980 [Candidatus Pacearchaeota archaeon]|nr:hypothetical protein [Candidatus Pacearchaeota archaeon]
MKEGYEICTLCEGSGNLKIVERSMTSIKGCPRCKSTGEMLWIDSIINGYPEKKVNNWNEHSS